MLQQEGTAGARARFGTCLVTGKALANRSLEKESLQLLTQAL